MIDLKCGDCLELMKDIPDNSVDMILCDLPYGTTACKWDTIIPFEPLWEEYNRIIKDNRAIVLFGSEPFSSYLRMSNIKNYKYDWIWDKVKPFGHLIVKYKPLQRTENISVFCSKTCMYNPIMSKREKPVKSKEYKRTEILGGEPKNVEKVLTEKYPQNVLVFSNASQKNKLHPTQKPVALLQYLIKTYTNEGETVLDNCMGSGSTGVACVIEKRNFIGIELDNQYFNVAKDRIHREEMKKRLF